ncbi:MAG TPA: pyridoxal-phosphate dependent enzyme [Saprospiraceae bacterium]|nr:pyridoxal-phosphate dependent enzyme [Saprospiraceae bacterium]
MDHFISRESILRCHEVIRPFIHETPVITSSLLNHLTGSKLYFKCENFQKTGSYKMRGALQAILKLSGEHQNKGVVTHSSGNFAQALAKAAQSLGVKAYIVMPSNAPSVKKDGVRTYGGTIIESEPTLIAREEMAGKVIEEYGASFIHPSNDIEVITGQGTAALELIYAHPHLEYILAPVGGGGLIAGTAVSAYYFGNSCQVIGAEPEKVDDAYRSLISGNIESNLTTHTIADGLRTQLGDQNFPIIKQGVSQIITVSESAIISAMQLIWERMKIIVEPSSAVALAAVLKESSLFKNKETGIIISGGNVDLSPYFHYLRNNWIT